MIALVCTVLMLTSWAQPAWQMSPNNVPLWDGKPYLPVGLRIAGTPEAIRQAHEAGVADVLVTLPADGVMWDPAIEELERHGLRYLIEIASMAPAPIGIAVEPQGYRVPGINARQRVSVRLPGASQALVVLAASRDSSVVEAKQVEVRSGMLVYDADPGNDLDHVLLVYPLTREPIIPDAWEGLDAHRDQLMAALRAHRPAMKGLRGIVNPMGRVLQFPGVDPGFVPTTPLFRMELEANLRHRYTTPAAAIRAWALRATDVDSFEVIARLVPLWSNTRGVGQLWDPDTGRLHVVEKARSAAWADIRLVIRETMARRYANLARSVRDVAGVPVIQNWAGWTGPYASQTPDLDGMGTTASIGSAIDLVEDFAQPAATVLRWRSPGWLVATDLRLPSEDPERALAEAVADSASLGARGWFVDARSEAERRAVGAASVRAAAPASLATWRPTPLFFPEAARNPAAPMRLTGGAWWLPSPGAGNRLDLGSQFAAYRLSDGAHSGIVMWSLGSTGRVRLRAADPKALRVRRVDGSDPAPRVVRGTLEVEMSPVPILVEGSDDIPIPEPALAETIAEFDRALSAAGARAGAASGEVMAFRSAAEAFERNPGGSFATMRAHLTRLQGLAGNWLWIEGESSQAHTWSEVADVSGASGGSALQLRTRLATPIAGYVARFRPLIRVQGLHEIWIAGRFARDHGIQLTLSIGDQLLRPSAPPVSLYAEGFGWLRLGEASFVPGPIEFEVRVESELGADLALDAIVLSPAPFRPDGLRRPPL